MPASIIKNRLRIAVDNVLSRGTALFDALTGKQEQLWQAEDCQVELGIFSNGVIAADLTNFANVTFEIRDPMNLDAAPLIVSTQSTINPITLANWQNGTAQNVLFPLTSAQTNIALNGLLAKTLNFYFFATTSDPFRLPLGYGTVQLNDSGYADLGSITVLPPGAKMSGGHLYILADDNLYYPTGYVTVGGTLTLGKIGPGIS